MRIGLIARADRSGLGVQTLEFYRAMQPAKVLVIDVSQFADNDDHCNKLTDLSLYPDAMVCKGWLPHQQQLVQFLRGIDVVFSAETFYSDELIPLAKRMGVRTVLQPNWEFAPLHMPLPDLLAVPSMWHWDEFPDTKEFLPVPIALDRFGECRDSVTSGTRHFLHVAGRPAVYDRNGTPDVLAALPHVRSEIRLTIKCQHRSYIDQLLSGHLIPPNVHLEVDSSNTENYWDNYASGDVMILPRRYGGLCLPMNEALGAGMPIITTDIDPNNTWLPLGWLVPSKKVAEFHAMNRVDVYRADPIELASTIDRFATDDLYFGAAKNRAVQLGQELSWDSLRPEYEKVLAG